MTRIDKTFNRLRRKRKKAFIAFITAGYPNLKATVDLAVAMEGAGVDILELGIPFSDPMADGPVIQASSQKALEKGITLKGIFNAVKRVRSKSQIPLALMTYYNPVFHYGEREFVRDAKKAGVDGLIIPDLPIEEAGNLRKFARKAKINTIFFLAPTTPPKRARQIAAASSGFIYYLSFEGITGANKKFSKEMAQRIKSVKRFTKKPVCVGFGVSTREQVQDLNKISDGVIVGSVIIKKINQNIRKRSQLVARATNFIANLKGKDDV